MIIPTKPPSIHLLYNVCLILIENSTYIFKCFKIEYYHFIEYLEYSQIFTVFEEITFINRFTV